MKYVFATLVGLAVLIAFAFFAAVVGWNRCGGCGVQIALWSTVAAVFWGVVKKWDITVSRLRCDHSGSGDASALVNGRKLTILAGLVVILALGTLSSVVSSRRRPPCCDAPLPRPDHGARIGNEVVSGVISLRKAAEQGNADAQFRLAECYAKAMGVEADSEEAFRWYRMAGEQGQVEAAVKLGHAYLSGSGSSRDDVLAVKWFRKAAQTGNPEAEFWLGLCYANGRGVAASQRESLDWYRKAAEKGFQPAIRATKLSLRIEKGGPTTSRSPEERDALAARVPRYPRSGLAPPQWMQALRSLNEARCHALRSFDDDLFVLLDQEYKALYGAYPECASTLQDVLLYGERMGRPPDPRIYDAAPAAFAAQVERDGLRTDYWEDPRYGSYWELRANSQTRIKN